MNKPLRESFARALKTWVDAHPSPDTPALSLGNGYLSPRQLAKAVKNNSPEGQMFCKIVDHAAKASGLTPEQIFTRLQGPKL